MINVLPSGLTEIELMYLNFAVVRLPASKASAVLLYCCNEIRGTLASGIRTFISLKGVESDSFSDKINSNSDIQTQTSEAECQKHARISVVRQTKKQIYRLVNDSINKSEGSYLSYVDSSPYHFHNVITGCRHKYMFHSMSADKVC